MHLQIIILECASLNCVKNTLIEMKNIRELLRYCENDCFHKIIQCPNPSRPQTFITEPGYKVSYIFNSFGTTVLLNSN